MEFKEYRSLFLALLTLASVSGCASMPKTDVSGIELDNLRQLIGERDARISRLQEISDDQNQQLRVLNDALNECKGKFKNCEKTSLK